MATIGDGGTSYVDPAASVAGSSNQSLQAELGDKSSSCKRPLGSEGVEVWEDIGDYMKSKKRKLNDQFQGMAQAKKTDIFRNVTIYVNGWTQPDADELKSLMHAHGGNYVYHMWSGTHITHVIATNLPNVKVRNIGDTIVCSPEWIVDSIAAGKQLPVQKYQLYSRNGAGQRRLRFRRVESKTKKGGDRSVKALKVHKAPEPSNGASDEAPAPSVYQPSNSEAVASSSLHPVPTAPTPPGYHPSKGADFVEEFFSHSRLHYLSTWSSELKQFTSKLLPQIQPKNPKLPPTTSLRGQKHRAVVHIDIDCFFVSVSIRDKPHLEGKPVAVTHAKGKTGKSKEKSSLKATSGAVTAQIASPGESPYGPGQVESTGKGNPLGGKPEGSAGLPTTPQVSKNLLNSVSDIASCSYEARRAGVHNGMWVGEALKLCPDLVLVPYDFDAYHQVSHEFYKTMMGYSSVIEAVSCDEGYIELTDYADSMEQVQIMVQALRDEVKEKTGCTVSAGISQNMLLARMATRLAKPNGQFCLPHDNLHDFLSPQPVHDLPGVGYSLSQKLSEMKVETCGQLKAVSLSKLQAEFGVKTGRMLHDYSRGIDDRELKLEQERKSLSADVNFGIRFSNSSEAESFLIHLASEVEKRADEAKVLASSVTLKLKVRKPEASVQPRKYLGHGICDNVSRSHTLPHPTRSASEIGKVTISLFKQLNLPPTDVRGVGIQLNKLVPGLQPSGRASAADIRTMMSKVTSVDSTSHTHAEKGHCRSPADPPLPRLVTQNPVKDLYSHAGTSLAVELGHQLEAVGTTSSSTAHITTACSSAGSELDEYFAIDLPPASQLDTSVLEALPAALKDKILKTYSDKASESPRKVATSVQPEASRPAAEESSSYCVVGDDSEFVASFRAYLKDWVDHSLDSAIDKDVEKVTDYLVQISRTNLTVVLCVLRYFRRLLTQRELTMWYPAFNRLLDGIQDQVKSQYHGTLPICEIEIL